MRGSKAKQLRRYAARAIQYGLKMQVRKSGMGQDLSQPARYLYQSFKGKNTNLTYQQEGRDGH